ncbi:MAG: right-handed parallel beta-helix repeat-containing protein [Candidatus Hodarchaeales archaeon]|jgi:parallel beta-helix repeat protein
MKKNSLFFVWSILIILIGLNSLFIIHKFQVVAKNPVMNETIDIRKESAQRISSSESYTSHPVIKITHNDNFTNIPAYEFTGSGTSGDPYRLAWKVIATTDPDMINIQDTTAHFILEHNLLNGSGITNNGIWIENVTNAIIKDNFICNQIYNSIVLTDSENSIISSNKIFNQTYSGIYLDKTSNITVLDNIIHNCTEIASGIETLNSMNNYYSYNTIDEYYTGIFLNDNSNLTTISYNVIFNNIYHGVGLFGSHNNTVYHNIIFNNEIYGTRIGQGAVGIANYNNVTMNDYSQNNMLGTGVQVNDEGSFTNIFSQNYYSDWTGTGSYTVSGPAQSKDLSPAENPHHLTAPVITYPTSEIQVLKDSVIINWIASSDTVDHSINYTIFYSTNGGTTWIELISGWTMTSYSGDLSTLNDGTIHIKVQAMDSVGFHCYSNPTSFTIHSTSPTVTIDSPMAKTYTTSTINVMLSGDPDHYWYYIESVDTLNRTWTASVDRTLDDGVYILHAYGNNSIGTITHVFLAFTIDTSVTTSNTTQITSSTTRSNGTPGWAIGLACLSLIAIIVLKKHMKRL